MENRFHEGQVRYEGFRGLGILWPKGWLYIFVRWSADLYRPA